MYPFVQQKFAIDKYHMREFKGGGGGSGPLPPRNLNLLKHSKITEKAFDPSPDKQNYPTDPWKIFLYPRMYYIYTFGYDPLDQLPIPFWCDFCNCNFNSCTEHKQYFLLDHKFYNWSNRRITDWLR